MNSCSHCNVELSQIEVDEIVEPLTERRFHRVCLRASCGLVSLEASG
jgi:hypothetical protein